jgi:anion-transporting  ArsA/GET3 family ATPase
MIVKATDKIVFVTGKGGVGKSTVAASIALQQARRGRKVLLAELGEARYLSDLFNREDVGVSPVKIADGLDLARFDVENCLRQYVTHYIHSASLYDLFFSNRVMRAFVRAAPALSELALLGKITSRERQVGPTLPHDLIVVDSFATGHTMALLRAPAEIRKIVTLGPMGKETDTMNRVVRDQTATRFVVVTLPEELPVIETAELCHSLKTELGQTPTVVCNKVWQASLPNGWQPTTTGDSQYSHFEAAIARDLPRQALQLQKLSQTVTSPLYLLPFVSVDAAKKNDFGELQKRLEGEWTPS